MITLAPVRPEDQPRVAHIATAPEQEVFAGTVAEAFAEDPARFDLHLIAEAGTPVGLFKIDRDYAQTMPIAAPGALGLRAFMIDRAHQGRGIATQAVRALGPYLRGQYPNHTTVDLTVNHRNGVARACYLNGGFTDTGADWPHGKAGPQDLLRLVFQDA